MNLTKQEASAEDKYIQPDNKDVQLDCLEKKLKKAHVHHQTSYITVTDNKTKVTTAVRDDEAIYDGAVLNLQLQNKLPFNNKKKDPDGYTDEVIEWRTEADDATACSIIDEFLDPTARLETIGQNAFEKMQYCLKIGLEGKEDRIDRAHTKLIETKLSAFSGMAPYLTAFKASATKLRMLDGTRLTNKQTNALAVKNVGEEFIKAGTKYREASQKVKDLNREAGGTSWDLLEAIFLAAEGDENALDAAASKRPTEPSKEATLATAAVLATIMNNMSNGKSNGKRKRITMTCTNCGWDNHTHNSCRFKGGGAYDPNRKHPRRDGPYGTPPPKRQSDRDHHQSKPRHTGPKKAAQKAAQKASEKAPEKDDLDSLFVTFDTPVDPVNPFSTYNHNPIVLWKLSTFFCLSTIITMVLPPQEKAFVSASLDTATALLSGLSRTTMVIDGGSTVHIVCLATMAAKMYNTRAHNCGSIMMNSHREEIEMRGDIDLGIIDENTGAKVKVTLRDVAYVPTSKFHLFSVSKYLDAHAQKFGDVGATVNHTVDGACIRVKQHELWGPRVGNLYYFNLDVEEEEKSMIQLQTKAVIPSSSSTQPSASIAIAAAINWLDQVE